MGCGVSKFDPEGKVIQSASIHPLLKRRILDQLRRRRRDSLNDLILSHSTKQLLSDKVSGASGHKHRNSSVSTTSLKLDHDDNANDASTPLTPSSVPSKSSDSVDDDINELELPKPTYEERHKQTSSLENVNHNDIKINADTTITITTTTGTPPATMEESFDHHYDDRDSVANNNNTNTDLPDPLVIENRATIIHHQNVVVVDEHQHESAAATEKDKKNQNGQYLLLEEEAEEVVVVVINEEEEDPSSLYPGSPSFRFYCINSPIISDDDNEDSRDDYNQYKEDDATIKKTESGGTVESENSSEGQESVRGTTKNGNWKTIRRIRKKMGGRGTKSVKVKQLLNVKACYNPTTACLGGHDQARLLTAHKQATVSS